MIEKILEEIVLQKKIQGLSQMLIRNYLKEYIQYLTLYLIYNQKDYKNMVFNGGSCLRICYELPRLSEDLDFDYEKSKLGDDLLVRLDNFLKGEIKKKYLSTIETKVQSDVRLYLKFPILKKLGLSEGSETDKLYVKIETSDKLSPDAGFALTPVSKYGFNFIVYSYDKPSLMAGKINALLYRIWYKGKNKEVDIKGRDFYDLFWFLQNKVEPNWKMLEKTTGIQNRNQLKSTLIKKIKESVTPQKLAYDLNNFINDPQFVKDFSRNYSVLIDKYF